MIAVITECLLTCPWWPNILWALKGGKWFLCPAGMCIKITFWAKLGAGVASDLLFLVFFGRMEVPGIFFPTKYPSGASWGVRAVGWHWSHIHTSGCLILNVEWIEEIAINPLIPDFLISTTASHRIPFFFSFFPLFSSPAYWGCGLTTGLAL